MVFHEASEDNEERLHCFSAHRAGGKKLTAEIADDAKTRGGVIWKRIEGTSHVRETRSRSCPAHIEFTLRFSASSAVKLPFVCNSYAIDPSHPSLGPRRDQPARCPPRGDQPGTPPMTPSSPPWRTRPPPRGGRPGRLYRSRDFQGGAQSQPTRYSTATKSNALSAWK